MKPRIIYIHGNGATHWSFAWAEWLRDELNAQGYPTFFETMPDSIIARAEYWLPFLKDHVQAGKDDVLVGWSSGAVAAMRYAENVRVKGSVLVSPCYTDLGDELEAQSGYYSDPWDWGKIRQHQEQTALFCGDNDPFIPRDEFEHIAAQLKITPHVIPHAGHFIDRTTFPELLEYIVSSY